MYFHENPSNGSRVVTCRRTEGRTDITRLVAGFRFQNASKNENKPTKPRRLKLSSGIAQKDRYTPDTELTRTDSLHFFVE